MTDLPTIRTAPIPTPSQIADINAGVMAGSRYHNALAETWAAIRAEYDERMARRFANCRMLGEDPDSNPRAAARACHDIVTAELGDAIEWAQTLESSVPCQHGSHTEISYFASEARKALSSARHLDGNAVSRLRALRGLGDLSAQRKRVQRDIAATIKATRALGSTWSDIGAALGVSKQAAQKRYG